MADRIIERLEYKTQVHTAWDGSEQRMALRSEPRRSVSYDYVGMESWQSQYLRMLTFGQQTQRLRFPLWHAQCLLDTKQYKGQASINIPTKALWGYRNIGAVMLWSSDNEGGVKYDLKYITASGALGLTKQLKSDWQAQCTLVVPVFYGILSQESNYHNIHSRISEMTINLELLQNQDAPPFPPSVDEWHNEVVSAAHIKLPERYMGAEVFTAAPPWQDDMPVSCGKNANRIDNETGVFRYDLKSEDTTETRQLEYIGISRPECYNFQRFFIRHKGMLKSFYAPTWLNDIALAGDMPSGQIYLLVNLNMYWKYYAKSKRRRTIVVFYIDGTCEILKIAGYSVDDTGEHGKLYLETNLTHTIYKSRVRMISYFCRYRFNSDILNVNYETNTAASMELGFKEVDD